MASRPVTPLHRAEKVVLKDKTRCRAAGDNIAAIDFGTSHCSLAYTTVGYEDGVNTLRLNGTDERVMNAMLLKKYAREYDVVEFGQNARRVYSKLRPDEKASHVYFEHIKMNLQRDEELSRNTTIKSFQNVSYYLVEVIAFILKHFKKKLVDHLAKTAIRLEATDFDWVITVPAIWRPRGKRMMREAAYMAGLLSVPSINTFSDVNLPLNCPEEINPERLTLALEPESAAIYSQKITEKEIKKGRINEHVPKKYMLVDIGGGTVDITSHIHDAGGGHHVVSVPIGTNCGGTKINEEFGAFLAGLLQDEHFQDYLTSQNETGNIISRTNLNTLLYAEFEEEKIRFGHQVKSDTDLKDVDGIDKAACIEIPSHIKNYYREDRIRVAIQSIPDVLYTEDGNLQLTYRKMKELFEPTIGGILTCTIEAIDKLHRDIEMVYLVGGFGGCNYLHSRIKRELARRYPRIRVLVPTSPELAIVQGAVMWRRDPNIIKDRRSDATYGIGLTLPFDDAKHDHFYKFVHRDSGEMRCRNIFSVFLQIGDIIEPNVVFQTFVTPPTDLSTSVNIPIYCTDKVNVQYVKDKDDMFTVNKIGELVIKVPNPRNTKRDDRKVYVSMDFSGTEIRVKAHYIITREEVKTICDFLN